MSNGSWKQHVVRSLISGVTWLHVKCLNVDIHSESILKFSIPSKLKGGKQASNKDTKTISCLWLISVLKHKLFLFVCLFIWRKKMPLWPFLFLFLFCKVWLKECTNRSFISCDASYFPWAAPLPLQKSDVAIAASFNHYISFWFQRWLTTHLRFRHTSQTVSALNYRFVFFFFLNFL